MCWQRVGPFALTNDMESLLRNSSGDTRGMGTHDPSLEAPLHVVGPTFVNHTMSDYLLFQIPSKGAGMVYPSLRHLHSEQVIGQRK